MSTADIAIDHSKLEDISYSGNPSDDEVYNSEDDKDNTNEDVRDSFPNETVVANKKCKIYPKSRHYAVVRFGDGYADKAIALPRVICHEDEVIDGEKMISDISWGHDGWINARRDPSSSVKWKATLLWTGMRKPACLNNNAHHDDELWKLLLQEYQDLGDVDVSMKRVLVPTLKSVADDLNANEKVLITTRDCGLSGKDNGKQSNREFSNMLEDIDVSFKEEQRSEQGRSFVTVQENLAYVAVVEKVERDRLIFMPYVSGPKLPAQYQGSYSLSVSKEKVHIKGEWAGNLDLKQRVYSGESFNIRCDLLYDEENKDMFGVVKRAWNGKPPDAASVADVTSTVKSKKVDNSFTGDNKSLEPIDISLDAAKPQLIATDGYVKQITPSFVCVEPKKHEHHFKHSYPVMGNCFYFANGRRGDSYTDLTESDLKLHAHVKMRIAEIDGKMLVVSAWEPGAKPPKGDEAKANEWAKKIRQTKSQKTTSVVANGKLEEPTPQSQMSARPHSPSHFQLGEMRRPKVSNFCDPKPRAFRIPEKPPQLYSSFNPPENVSEVSTKRTSKGIMSSKSTNLSRQKSVSYQEPLSSPISMPQFSSFANREPKTSDSREFNNESENKTVSFSERSNPEAVLSIIERSFQKSIEKTKLSAGCEGANALREQILSSTKNTFIESLNKELHVPVSCAERRWATIENFINHIYAMGSNEMKGDVPSSHMERGLMNDSKGGVETHEAGTQTIATGRLFYEQFVIE